MRGESLEKSPIFNAGGIKPKSVELSKEVHVETLRVSADELQVATTNFEDEYNSSEEERAVADINEGFNEYAAFQKEKKLGLESSETERANKFFGDYKQVFDERVKEIAAMWIKDPEAAMKESQALLGEAQRVGSEYLEVKINDWFSTYHQEIRKADSEPSPKKRSKFKELAMDGADFIPIVGPMKMLSESAAGKTLSGKELKGWKRMMHATEGGVFLALDLTGIGATAKTVKAPKLLTRIAAVMRKAGISNKVSKPVFRFGKFLARHPIASRVADKAIHGAIESRRQRKMEWGKKFPQSKV